MENKYFFNYKGPLKTSFEGLMIGNGEIGALIYGKDKLCISLDLVNLWDKRLPFEFKDRNFNYPYMLNCIKNDYKKLYQLFDDCYLHSYPTKLNAGRLDLDVEVNADSEFCLNFYEATFSFKNEKDKLNGYIDAYKNVLLIKSNNKLSYKYLLSKYFYKPIKDGGLNYCSPVEKKKNGFHYIKQKTYRGHFYYIVSKEIFVDETYFYLFTINKDSSLLTSKKTLNDYFKNKDKYFIKHKEYWANYFMNGVIVTPDEEINSQYIKGLYYFGSNSRKYPMTLQGVWTQNNDFLPPWKSDLHNDINVEMTYDSYFKTGHEKEGKVIVDYLYKKRRVFKCFAKKFMKSKGLLIPGVMSQDGLPLGGWPQYALNPMVSIWILKVFDDYYTYYPSETFLKKKAFYFFKNTELCIRKYLHINIDNKLEFDFHCSPEFFENDEKSLFKKQTNFEVTMLKFLYGTLIKYSKLLNIDSSFYEKQYSLISDFYKDENNHLMLSQDMSYVKSHRHFSHMLMLKNLKLVNPYEYNDFVTNNINYLDSFKYKEWVGFSFVESSGMFAYAFDGENAYKHLKIFIEAFIHPNGFHMNSDYKHLGYSDLSCYVMTLEANIGFVSSLSDMMVMDEFGIIKVFPAIPQKFKLEGTEFKNLHIKNDIFVSSKIKDNVINLVEFASTKDIDILLFNNICENPSFNIDGNIKTFKSKINDIILLKAKRFIKYDISNTEK